MPTLRPPPPEESCRCSRSEGRHQCRNERIRGKLFCRFHLPLSSLIKKKKRSPQSNGSISTVRVPSPSNQGYPSPVRVPPEESYRCTRSDGWQRCNNKRPRGKPFCGFHLKKKRRSPQSNGSRSRAGVPSPSNQGYPSPVRVPSPKSNLEGSFVPMGFPWSPTSEEVLWQMDLPGNPQPGEIWAVPHESDAIPRSYARIERVDPARSMAEITPLDFHPISDDDFRILTLKLPISCGTFRLGDSPVSKEIRFLCHRVGLEEDVRVSELRSFYTIFPKKDEIWAIYRDCNGSVMTPVFRLVEVLAGFSEREGVTAVELEAVEGSMAEFRRQKDSVCRFSRMELLLFSHRVTGLKLVKSGG